MWIFVHIQNYYRENKAFSKLSQFRLIGGNQCKNIPALGFARVLSYKPAEMQTINSNNCVENYQVRQEIRRQFINIGINGVTTIFGQVSKVIEK
jgi:hypothetical protein